MRRKMNDSQADSLQTRKSERNVARAAKCATDKGLGKTCDVPERERAASLLRLSCNRRKSKHDSAYTSPVKSMRKSLLSPTDWETD